MNKETISNYQAISISILFILGSSVVLGSGYEARQDVWIAVLTAALMAVPAFFVYARILSRYPGRDLFDILQLVFGKFIGKAISLLYVWYSFHLGSLVLRNFSEFVKVVALPETPQFVVIFFLGVLSIWCIKRGFELLAKWSAFVMPMVVSLTVLLSILLIKEMRPENLKPLLYNGYKPILSNAFSTFAFPFAETVIFLTASSSLKGKKSSYKVYYISLAIGAAELLIISLRNLLVLGAETITMLNFQSYSAVSLINIGDFLQRIEASVSISFLLTGFVKISVCLYAASIGTSKVFGLWDYRPFAAPVGLLMMNLAMFVYENTMEMFDWASRVYKFYAFPFQFMLPVIILIAVEIKTRASKRTKAAG